ncbi:bifunctional glutamate N-acetyltransferase/amino-acid acetyltransferase ArgJ [Hydrogenovibrio kuenenii]|uniref:bifunctional glutamate N-acetyltransferase/amino-acid acetyltransferase ArgJ n=1 Tax=Hydrogenovibrio kuenenii TaxID=63658 RepID=UPI000464A249|nr:bifunctional glutamate N-acetyltransferase/amino-acid acetyltransferase ArgJ [Hydrogenovibrio kuenenii]
MNTNTAHPVQGVYLGTTCAKIKKSGAEDFVLLQFNDAAVTVATFTQNAFCAAPVTLAKRHLAVKAPKALVINSGNANAGTGKQGMMDAEQTCAWVANELGCSADEVLPFSTGVIGQNLPMQKVQQAIPMAAANLKIDGWSDAMKGIMTTDTVEKIYSEKVSIQGHEITLTGISKGSGMIHPNMATMLGFVATDAKITRECLQQAMTDAVNLSFNRITVDGDTSTNDACTLTATQQADMPTIEDSHSMAYQEFANALNHCMMTLAQKIVRDGEGATKFVAVEVENARSSEEALKVAHAVALSPLVKTALFASDPNWGRILAAVGRAGVENFDIDAIQIYLGDVLLVENGGRADSYTEEAGQAVMNETDINIKIILNRGEAGEVVWTTDFSYDYVKINAEYRT